ncbi:uncharacterized protein [Equus asinus]|uniref:protein FAM156A/FAM156B isoform X2 n=1 Tax=Equus asinus TaxID=9793 RepID=UPI0038F67FD2
MAPTSVHISTPGPAQNNDRTNASVSGEVPPLTEMPPEPTRNHTIHSAPGGMKLLFACTSPGIPGNEEWPRESACQGHQHHLAGPPTVGSRLCFQLSMGRRALFHLLCLGDLKAGFAAGPQTVA